MFSLDHERPEHAAEIDHLLDLSFGPGRYAKTSYRLREGIDPIPELSFVVFLDEGPGVEQGAPRRMVGSVRFWPILIGDTRALLLGPLAVDPAIRGKGAGIALMKRGLDEAVRHGHRLVILVGDAPYYAKAGFAPVPPGRVVLPGPVDPARLLYRELAEGAFDGVSGAARAAT